MFRVYPPVLILQAYCLYHAYQYKVNSIWYFMIVFIPIIGSLIYLYKFVYSRQKMENITEGVKEVIDTNYKEKKLTHNLNHTDTIANKTKLAEEYFNQGSFDHAIELYDSCLTTVGNDPDIIKKLVLLHFYNKNYTKSIEYGERIIEDTFFKNDEERIALAWSYYHIGEPEKANQHFEDMNRTFSNYIHRVEYVKFLKLIDENTKAKLLLETLTSEFNRMEKTSRRHKADVYNDMIKEYDAYR